MKHIRGIDKLKRYDIQRKLLKDILKFQEDNPKMSPKQTLMHINNSIHIELSNSEELEFIRVKDDLPTEDGIYEVMTAHSSFIEKREFVNGQFANYDGYQVTHWLPIKEKVTPIN